MSKVEFERLPWLLFRQQAGAVLGYSPYLMAKLIEARVLLLKKPAGAGRGKLMKRQVADLLRVDWSAPRREFEAEPALMTPKRVMAWTGYNKRTLAKIARAGGLRAVKLPGGEYATRFHREQVADLIWRV